MRPWNPSPGPPGTEERGQGEICPYNAVIGVTVSSRPQGRALRRTVNNTQVGHLSGPALWKAASTVVMRSGRSKEVHRSPVQGPGAAPGLFLPQV